MKRILTVVAILGLVWGSVQAQDVELREDHPREYVVQEGDTLWDIASRFLTRPWQWPAIWQANPKVVPGQCIDDANGFTGLAGFLELLVDFPDMALADLNDDLVHAAMLRLPTPQMP